MLEDGKSLDKINKFKKLGSIRFYEQKIGWWS